MTFGENDLIDTIWLSKNSKIIIRSINSFRLNNKDLAEIFINLNTFPYTNTLYGKIINNDFSKLNRKNKAEILAILDKYQNEIDLGILKKFEEVSDDDLVDYFCFDEAEISSKTRTDLFSSVSGGQYCEMLLTYIAICLGYEKILPKLYFEWGYLSPTGIDVPYLDLENKKLLLGECKLYKNIKSAIKSVYNDLNSIYNYDKFDKEVKEWRTKIGSIDDNIANFLLDNDIYSKGDLLTYIKEVDVVGFVVGNSINQEDLKKIIDSYADFGFKKAFNVYMIVIPIDSKDAFVECCHNVIGEMKRKVEEMNE